MAMFTSAFMHHNMYGFIPYAEKMLREGLLRRQTKT